jgi:uncharacterized protein (DUF433 family)
MAREIFPRITVDPEVCFGKPVIAGTRVRVMDVLAMLAGGATRAEILSDFPYLKDCRQRTAALSIWRSNAPQSLSPRVLTFQTCSVIPRPVYSCSGYGSATLRIAF